MQQYNITGMSCAACSARIEKAVSKVPGVASCSVSLLTNSMGVEGTASAGSIISAVEKAGYGASVKTNNVGQKAPRVNGADAGGTGEDDSNTDVSGMDTGAGSDDGYDTALADKETPRLRKRLIASVGFLLVLMYLSMGHMMWGWPLPGFFDDNHVAMGLAQLLLAGIIMVINQKFFISGFKGLIHGAPNMDTLVALGSGAAFVYSTVALFAMTDAQVKGNQEAVMHYMHEFYFESAAMILALITVGKMLEARSKGKTTDALKSLMKLAPKTAVILENEEEKRIPVNMVKKGDIFIVRPGENIPVDGVVLEGSSAVNEAALTGESIPVDKEEGATVSAATLNQSGFLKCEATRVGEDTTLSQIIRMVSDAAATKAPVAKVADKVSGIFVPAVIAISVITIMVWLILGETVGFALARGISVLVISCPCALGLATPVAIMVGNGVGAKNGILFKTAVSLEETGKVDVVALDKTGTITAGEPKVTDMIPAENISKDELLALAYILESKSEHPLAKAVADAYENQLKATGADSAEKSVADVITEDFRAVPGNGLWAKVVVPDVNIAEKENIFARIAKNSEGQITLLGGNYSFISQKVEIPETAKLESEKLSEEGKTPLFFCAGNKFIGIIAVADVIKEDSTRAVAELQNMGIRVVMITGDNEKTAKAVGGESGVDEVIAGVLPEGKEMAVRKLMEDGSRVAMVGDGINDAPALTRANIGIAIGAGTDVAIDAADIVLMKSSLRDVPAAIRLSRATLRNIHENLFWAFIYNTIGIPLAAGVFIKALGWQLNPMFGAAAMSLSSFCVVSNALRLNLTKIYDTNKDRRGRKKVKRIVVDNQKNENDLNENKQVENEKDSCEAVIEGVTITGDIARNDNKRKGETAMEKTLRIEGMMCGHCEAHVKKALEALPQVDEAVVSHTAGTAVVKLNAEVENEALKRAVEEQDYKVISVK
ncbi:MAG: heavy metal translocating P-type ATPase [Lachnospiraceae bacterium]